MFFNILDGQNCGLSPKKVEQVRRLLQFTKLSQYDIAKATGVLRSSVKNIKKNGPRYNFIAKKVHVDDDALRRQEQIEKSEISVYKTENYRFVY